MADTAATGAEEPGAVKGFNTGGAAFVACIFGFVHGCGFGWFLGSLDGEGVGLRNGKAPRVRGVGGFVGTSCGWFPRMGSTQLVGGKRTLRV